MVYPKLQVMGKFLLIHYFGAGKISRLLEMTNTEGIGQPMRPTRGCK
jgi:hypothetical protein